MALWSVCRNTMFFCSMKIYSLQILGPMPPSGRRTQTGLSGQDTIQADTFQSILNISLRSSGTHLALTGSVDFSSLTGGSKILEVSSFQISLHENLLIFLTFLYFDILFCCFFVLFLDYYVLFPFFITLLTYFLFTFQYF